MTATPRLLPCPLCGAPACTHFEEFDHEVRCRDCSFMHSEMAGSHRTPAEAQALAIASWNTVAALTEFGRRVAREWMRCVGDIDGGWVEEQLVDAGVARIEEFDPDRHRDVNDADMFEEGDPVVVPQVPLSRKKETEE